jgi:hypothetical protein
MSHAVLDSMGLPGVTSRVRFDDARTAVTIAVPSFATLWRAACGDRPVPRDSAFLYGTVRAAANGDPVPGSSIALTWSAFQLRNQVDVAGRRIRSETESDANGEYSVCGVPQDEGLRLEASHEGLAGAAIDIIPGSVRIMRRDLLLGPADTTNSTARGTISGRVSLAEGGPFAGATIVLDDTPAGRTGPDGRFTLHNVVAGTHQVEVLGIGAKPQVFTVAVMARGTAEVAATLSRVTRLEEVRVIASPWQMRLLRAIEDRKRSGFAKFIDSTEAAKRLSTGMMVSTIAGVRAVPVGRSTQGYSITMLGPNGRPCQPTFLVDGIRVDIEQFLVLSVHEVGVTEVYTRAPSVPIELQRGISSCGMIVIWTKRSMP